MTQNANHSGPAGSVGVLLRALRVHQWAKNALLFVPLLLAHRIGDLPALLTVAHGVIAFSLCASGAYVVNDLFDLEHDRKHPYKRLRPFAAGALRPAVGRVLAPLLILAGVLVALAGLPRAFVALLVFYLVLTLAYSLWLRSIALVDVFALAGLYTLRVLAGGVVVAVEVSPWLLGFSGFFFLGLAFLKRYADLVAFAPAEPAARAGRDYAAGDAELIRGLGTASSYLSVLVLSIYMSSDRVARFYVHPAALWVVSGLILFWITRMWLLAHRGRITRDPVEVAITDPLSWLLGGVVVAVILLASR